VGGTPGEGFKLDDGDGLYWSSDTSKASWDWIASPSSRDDGNGLGNSLYYVANQGISHVAAYSHPSSGLRPVVCLKYNTQLEKTGDGVYKIK